MCVTNIYGCLLTQKKWKGGIIMSGKIKSKTDVAARSDAKSSARLCSFCGNKVNVVLAVSPTGKKNMKRLCCEE